jgi:hypothetical protein
VGAVVSDLKDAGVMTGAYNVDADDYALDLSMRAPSNCALEFPATVNGITYESVDDMAEDYNEHMRTLTDLQEQYFEELDATGVGNIELEDQIWAEIDYLDAIEQATGSADVLRNDFADSNAQGTIFENGPVEVTWVDANNNTNNAEFNSYAEMVDGITACLSQQPPDNEGAMAIMNAIPEDAQITTIHLGPDMGEGMITATIDAREAVARELLLWANSDNYFGSNATPLPNDGAGLDEAQQLTLDGLFDLLGENDASWSTAIANAYAFLYMEDPDAQSAASSGSGENKMACSRGDGGVLSLKADLHLPPR